MMRDLTEQQQNFVTAFTSTPGAIGNASEAARRAMYSEKSARDIGQQLLAKPHVRAAIEEANRAQISGSLASKAVDVLRGIIEDENAPPKLRLDAAKTALDRAGYIAPKAREPSDPRNAKLGLGDLSTHELQGYVAYLQAMKNKADPAAEDDNTAEVATPRLVGSASA